jgi:cytochrome P450
MSVTEVVRGTAREGVARTMLWVMRRSGDPGVRLLDKRMRVDPYGHYDTLRAAGPLVPSRLGWLTASHGIADTVLRHPRFGHGEPQPATDPVSRALQPPVAPDLVDPVGPESMIGMDPPDHTRLRGLVSKVFTARAIERLTPRVDVLANELLDGPARSGRFDLMADFAGPLPVLVICEVLGIPSGQRAQFSQWGRHLAAALDLTLSASANRRATAALRALHIYFDGLFEQRRKDPGEDLLSRLLHVEDQGDVLSHRELMATCLILLLAGFETTVNLLGNGTLALMRNPDQLALLREQPELMGNAVEEMLRYDSPVQLTARIALDDVELGGTTVHAGRSVMTILAGANRDPSVFEDPHRFDVARANARRHLAFASGPHHCLGAALSRLEGAVAFRALLARFPTLELAGPVRRRPTFLLRGLEQLPLAGGTVPQRHLASA